MVRDTFVTNWTRYGASKNAIKSHLETSEIMRPLLQRIPLLRLVILLVMLFYADIATAQQTYVEGIFSAFSLSVTSLPLLKE